VSFDQALRQGSEFFMKRDDVHTTLHRLSQRLQDAQIDYALIGGMALAAHGYPRFTSDVDILTTREGLDAIHQHLIGRGYVPAFQGARKALRDTTTNVQVEFITTGEYPGDGKPKPVRFPDPKDVAVERDGYMVISLPKLIELKLASGLSAAHRMRDLADVQDLIAKLDLPRSLEDEIDPSVRDEYLRMWEVAATSRDPQTE
jgi:hypothetical protein